MIVFTRRQCYFLFALLACAVSLQAQATFGRIFGTVTDRSGSVVPSAIVTITSVERGASRTTTTNESGEYGLPDVDLGSYVLSVQAQGFKTLQHPAVTITVKAQIRVDAQA
jgi:Carboxypeptidase regulatory-like domain